MASERARSRDDLAAVREQVNHVLAKLDAPACRCVGCESRASMLASGLAALMSAWLDFAHASELENLRRHGHPNSVGLADSAVSSFKSAISTVELLASGWRRALDAQVRNATLAVMEKLSGTKK